MSPLRQSKYTPAVCRLLDHLLIAIFRLQWVFHAYDELLQLWCYAPDLDSFEHAGNEVVTFTTGEVNHFVLYARFRRADDVMHRLIT